ncbi:ASCH domain-containing protein [Martelella sp. HB161492]|uniref:ASCH domain-containing protein n=1 Tax=Martelella sp. HB161492 TaxID=2720726 RepID=UPI001590E7B0|nr:ASCH domain-containing protein [Martelella sp. HB161492]
MTPLPELAISIRQPWTHCIMELGKDIENRNWKTNFRGRICIHAALGMTRDEHADCLATVAAINRLFPDRVMTVPTRANLQRGGIIGTVEIVDCVSDSDSPWFFGKYGFVLRDPQPVPFIPARGALGLFKWQPLEGGVA